MDKPIAIRETFGISTPTKAAAVCHDSVNCE